MFAKLYMEDHLKFLAFKESQFEVLKNEQEKALTYGRLKMLEDLAQHIETMRESYTRLLVVNGVADDEQADALLKDRHKGVKGLDGDLEMDPEAAKH